MVLVIVWIIFYRDLYQGSGYPIVEVYVNEQIYITGDLAVNSKPTIILIYIVP